MIVYIILLVIIMGAVIFTTTETGRIVSGRKYNFLINGLMLLLIIIQGIRASSVGGDLINYEQLYKDCGKIGWLGLYDFSVLSGYEIGYVLLNKVVHLVSGGNIQALLFVIAALYICAVGKLCNKLSCNRYLSMFFFVASYMYHLSMNNLRSAVAMVIIMLAIPALLEKKYLKFLIAIVISSFFHKTALVFLFFWGMVLIKNIYMLALIYGGVSVLFTIGYGLFARVIGMLFPKYLIYLNAESDGGVTFLLFILVVVLTIAITSNKKFWEIESNKILFKMLLCGMVLQIIALRSPFFVRAVYYHLISLAILLPALFVNNRLKDKSKIILYVSVLAGFWVYYVFFVKVDNTMTVPYKVFF